MKKIISIVVLFALSIASFVQAGDQLLLEQIFKNPPASAKPLTWMHFMSGNISKIGITKDLEAIANVGIGGVINFNVTHNIPNGPVVFNSPEHIEMTAFAAAECKRLGLSFGIHNSDGWTSSGGPWVTAENSMKQVVYREKIVEGGKVEMYLPMPSKIGGFYKDLAVLAYPSLESELIDAQNPTVITSSDPGFDVNIATNGKIDERTELNVPVGEKSWIQWDFGKPFTVRSFFIKTQRQRSQQQQHLQSSNDGVNFKNELTFNMSRIGKYEYTIDQTFEGITARYFRFVTDVPLDVSEISLTNSARYDDMISRTNIKRTNNVNLKKLQEVNADMVINKAAILNLTQYVNDKGVLNTTLPKGKWTIMRFGYTSTGAVNDPASIAGTGFEVDKFSREALKTHYENYVKNVVTATKKNTPNALQFLIIDSYEVGSQNWTQGYEAQFKANYGYDIMDFLPLYAGRYIDNAETTDAILWDVRNFNSKLMCANYFDYFTELAHSDGLKTYLEPYGNGPFNTLDAARSFDIPMAEFHGYAKSKVVHPTYIAASAGHIYGRNIISAEALTSGPDANFEAHPGTFKALGDRAWSMGINEFVFHRFAHQANTHVKPGMGMSGYGSHIDRTQTWWENAGKAWFEYLSRGQYLLRQGVPVSDLLVFVGDGSPTITSSRSSLRKLPNYINFDHVNADVLQNRVSAKNGKLFLPEGTSYQALYLTNVDQMLLSTLRLLGQFADEGVIIIGRKPTKIGGYMVSEKDKAEFNQLRTKVWGKSTTFETIKWDELYKKYLSIDLMIKDGEDINYTHRKTANEDIYFFYNPEKKNRIFECTFNVADKIPALYNPMNGEVTQLMAFEEFEGKTKVAIPLTPESACFVVFQKSSKAVKSVTIASAMSNANLSFKLKENSKGEVEIAKNGTYDLTFSDGSNKQIKCTTIPEDINIDGSWQVLFPDLKGGAQTFTFEKLIDWTTHEFEGVKYYSGTATYQKTFKVKRNLLASNRKLTLNLGNVNEIARVILNGKELGVSWKAPHVVDITSALVVGNNILHIEITNQWTNRLIGDENFPNVSGYDLHPQLNKTPLVKDPQLSLINRFNMPEWYTNNEPAPLGQRSTFTTYPFLKKGDKLLPAGLIGPVQINVSEIVQLDNMHN